MAQIGRRREAPCRKPLIGVPEKSHDNASLDFTGRQLYKRPERGLLRASDRTVASTCFDTMPSAPSLHARANTAAPSSAMCS
jgi:hypothetical protein